MRAIPPTTPPTIAPTGRDFEPDAEEATVDDVAVLWSSTELGALVAEAKTVVTQMAVLGVAWGWPTATASSNIPRINFPQTKPRSCLHPQLVEVFHRWRLLPAATGSLLNLTFFI